MSNNCSEEEEAINAVIQAMTNAFNRMAEDRIGGIVPSQIRARNVEHSIQELAKDWDPKLA